MIYEIEKPWSSQSLHIPLLSTTLLMYQLSLKCLISVQWQKNIFSFELHSNMLNLYWNDDVFNQGFVISPRTGILHAFMSPKRQNLTTRTSGEKLFLFHIHLKDYYSNLIV